MKKLAFAFFVFLMGMVCAQKMKVTSGNFDFLKGQTELNLQMDYSHMTFYKENMDETAYLAKQENDIRKAGKSPDEFEKWKKDWEYSKTTQFVDKFLASMNKNTDIRACLKKISNTYLILLRII